jgi:hypothetical protein
MSVRNGIYYSSALFCLVLSTSCGSAADTDNNDLENTDDSCTTPSGEYVVNWSDDGGNCPQELVNEITADMETREVEPDTSCGQFTASHSETLDNGCEVSSTETGEFTSSGVTNGQASVDISSCAEDNCSHEFKVYYEKQ